jgi:two-component system, response regulator RegA
MVRSVRRVLLVDTEERQLNAWQRDFVRLGWSVDTAPSPAREGAALLARARHPDVAIVEMRLGTESGLAVLADLKVVDRNIFVILVSNYMTVAWTMLAIKAGADFCFIKPLDCRQVVELVEQGSVPEPRWDHPRMNLDQFVWEHFCRVLVDCGNNISRAAEAMNMHVTTLRRKLEKYGALPLPPLAVDASVREERVNRRAGATSTRARQ